MRQETCSTKDRDSKLVIYELPDYIRSVRRSMVSYVHVRSVLETRVPREKKNGYINLIIKNEVIHHPFLK